MEKNIIEQLEERLDDLESKIQDIMNVLQIEEEHEDEEICDDCYDDPCACLPEDYDYEDEGEEENEDEDEDDKDDKEEDDEEETEENEEEEVLDTISEIKNKK